MENADFSMGSYNIFGYDKNVLVNAERKEKKPKIDLPQHFY